MDKATVGDVIGVAIFVLGALGSLVRHWWNQHHQRINNLENQHHQRISTLDERTLNIERELSTKVSVQQHSDTTDTLRRDILQSNREIREELQSFSRRLDKLIFKSIDEK